MTVLLSIGLACVLAQDAPQAKIPDVALFDELIRTTNGLHSFRAEYELRRSGEQEPKRVRLLYKSPGTALFDSGGQTRCRIQDGVFDFRTTMADRRPAYAHFDAAGPVRGRLSRLAEVVHREFSELSRSPDSLELGSMRLDLSVAETSDADGRTVDIRLGLALSGEPLLGWLDSLRKREARQVGGEDKLAFDYANGARLVLSTRTGFIESVEKSKKEGLFTLTLVDLDCDPTFKATEFELPEPAAEAADVSTELAEEMQELQTSMERNWIFARVTELASDKEFELNADRLRHLGRVFECVHADGLVLEKASSIARMKQRIDSFATAVRTQATRIRNGDEAAAPELERQIQAQSKTLGASIGNELKALESRATIAESVVPDAALRKSLHETEARAVQAACQPILRDLIAYFDTQVQRAKSGG
ncbi:MAG TPA: hypothetical protein VGR31_09095 [Planctomycetota bacterium]|jgi:hypothetical protein|nr:hypothetical protein [Planctomycetota bacterium]